jgi:predicted metalloendopeptidase
MEFLKQSSLESLNPVSNVFVFLGLSYLNQEARDIQHRYNKALNGIKEAQPTWKRCVEQVGFGSYSSSTLVLVTGSMYIRRYFKPGKSNTAE